MREGDGDKILAKVMHRKDGVLGKVNLKLKGTKPFAAEPLYTEEQLWAIDNLTMNDMDALFQEFGDDGILYLRGLREKLSKRRKQ